MTTAKEAYEYAQILLKAQNRRQTMEYIGNWNELMLFLEAKVREEKRNDSAQATPP